MSAPDLSQDEYFLIVGPTDCTTIYEGSNGYLVFRQWTLKGKAWKVDGHFMLGSMGRPSLVAFLARDPEAKIWRAVIAAEAATCFSDGSRTREYGPAAMADAKAWALSELARLLGAEEQVSQVAITSPAGGLVELDPSTWGGPSPRWIDVSQDPGDC